MKKYADVYHEQLWQSPDAVAYLMGRELSHSTIFRFKVGFVARPEAGHARYKGRISIPYMDGMWREIGLRYRAIGGQTPKYLAPKGFSHLFAVRATDHPVVYVTEGEFDAMVLWQIGLRAVAVPGAQAWKDSWRYLFRNCDEVVLLFDNDVPRRDPKTGESRNAGQLGASKVYRSLQQVGVLTRSVVLPEGMDVNDAYRVMGVDKLKEWLA